MKWEREKLFDYFSSVIQLNARQWSDRTDIGVDKDQTIAAGAVIDSSETTSAAGVKSRLFAEIEQQSKETSAVEFDVQLGKWCSAHGLLSVSNSGSVSGVHNGGGCAVQSSDETSTLFTRGHTTALETIFQQAAEYRHTNVTQALLNEVASSCPDGPNAPNAADLPVAPVVARKEVMVEQLAVCRQEISVTEKGRGVDAYGTIKCTDVLSIGNSSSSSNVKYTACGTDAAALLLWRVDNCVDIKITPTHCYPLLNLWIVQDLKGKVTCTEEYKSHQSSTGDDDDEDDAYTQPFKMRAICLLESVFELAHQNARKHKVKENVGRNNNSTDVNASKTSRKHVVLIATALSNGRILLIEVQVTSVEGGTARCYTHCLGDIEAHEVLYCTLFISYAIFT